MRRALTLLCALALTMGLPAAAVAGRLYRATDHTVSIQCDGILSTSGTGFAYVGLQLADSYGADAFLDAYNTSTPSGAADLTRDWDQPATVTWDGTTLAGSVPLLDASGQAAGSATFSAALAPVGSPRSFHDSSKDGNRRVTFDGQSQAMQATGLLSLPNGLIFDLANCYGDETTVTVTETNPNAFVRRFSQRFVGCDLANTAGDTGFMFVDLSDGGAFVDAGMTPADGSRDLGAFGSGSADGGVVNFPLDVYDPSTGDPTGDTGSIAMTAVATGESFTNLLKNATLRRTTRGELLDIEGSLTIAGHVFDLTSCIGQASTTKIVETNPQGPKPGGKVPSNDLPSGALLLKPGGAVTEQTKGASLVAEAPYDCLTFTDPNTGEVFVIPVGSTVWFRFRGTGAAMTVNTAGSDYDTVAAIYTASGGGYAPVSGGCVDDAPTPPIGRTLQSAVTIPTVAGTTYFVQIGGFPESFTYGTLKVALR